VRAFNEFDCFPILKWFLEEEGIEVEQIFIEEITRHLNGFSDDYNQYFSK